MVRSVDSRTHRCLKNSTCQGTITVILSEFWLNFNLSIIYAIISSCRSWLKIKTTMHASNSEVSITYQTFVVCLHCFDASPLQLSPWWLLLGINLLHCYVSWTSHKCHHGLINRTSNTALLVYGRPNEILTRRVGFPIGLYIYGDSSIYFYKEMKKVRSERYCWPTLVPWRTHNCVWAFEISIFFFFVSYPLEQLIL